MPLNEIIYMNNRVLRLMPSVINYTNDKFPNRGTIIYMKVSIYVDDKL